MGSMGNLGNTGSGQGLSRQTKCFNCKLDVTIGPAAQKIKCPRCGCGIFLDLVIPQNGQPTIDPRQYTESETQNSLFKNPRRG